MPYGLDMGSKASRGPKKWGFGDLGGLAHTPALERSKKGGFGMRATRFQGRKSEYSGRLHCSFCLPWTKDKDGKKKRVHRFE